VRKTSYEVYDTVRAEALTTDLKKHIYDICTKPI